MGKEEKITGGSNDVSVTQPSTNETKQPSSREESKTPSKANKRKPTITKEELVLVTIDTYPIEQGEGSQGLAHSRRVILGKGLVIVVSPTELQRIRLEGTTAL